MKPPSNQSQLPKGRDILANYTWLHGHSFGWPRWGVGPTKPHELDPLGKEVVWTLGEEVQGVSSRTQLKTPLSKPSPDTRGGHSPFQQVLET